MPWSGCSLADGEKKRERSVLVEPKHGGSACPVLVEKENCVVNCLVSAFSTWSACDKASGTQVRTRTVEHEAKNDGTECPALSESKGCMVDCELSLWGAFGACDEAAGLKERTRSILVSALNNGKVCGMLEERDDCGQQCETGPWSPWTQCSKTGAEAGFMTRTRAVIKLIVGRPCRTTEKAACAVSCEVTEFGNWGPCDTANNVKIRERTVIVPQMNGGSACPSLELRDTCVVNCRVGAWTEWTDCDKQFGKTSRTRNIEMHPENGGLACPPTKEEIVCKVDCVLSDYGEWGVCDKNSGLKTRERDTIYVGRNGGTPCGQLTDSTDCMVHCEASQWGSFMPCLQSGAKIGTMRRARSVVVTSKNSGLPCTLEEEEKCAVPCLVTLWSDWSECDFILARQTRTRTIVSQPVNGGLQCPELFGKQFCGLPTPVPTPFVVAEPTPAPDPRELAIVPKTFDWSVQSVFRLSALTEDELMPGQKPREVVGKTVADQFGLEPGEVGISIEGGSAEATLVTVRITATSPIVAHSFAVELGKVKDDPARLTARLYQNLATEGFERAHLVSLSVVGRILVKGTIDAVSEHELATKDNAGKAYQHRMVGSFTLSGYDIPGFDDRVQRVFVFILAEHLRVDPIAVSTIAVNSGAQPRSVQVKILVKATTQDAADVAFRFQLATTDADKVSAEFRAGLASRLMPSPGVSVSSSGGIETKEIKMSMTEAEREAGTGSSSFQLDLEKVEAEQAKEEGTSMYVMAAMAMGSFIVVIGIAAIIVRRYKSRQEKNAFFDSMEDENDAENLLDDDDWANLGDWGDETFAGSNPTYDAGSSAGGDKAANEL
jgi:hypothetical protein